MTADREMLRAVIRGIADEVWFCDTQGNTRQLNPAAVEGLGFERDAETPLDALLAELEILKPDGTPRTLDENPMLHSLKGEVCRGEEIARHRKTGEMRYRRYTTSPVRNARGEIIGAVAVTRDVTDLRRVEEEFRESEARFRSLYQSLPYFAVVYEKRGDEFVLSDHNVAAVSFTNGGIAALVGKTAREIYGARPDMVEYIERAYAAHTVLQYAGAYKLVTTGEEKYINTTFVFVAPDRVLLYVQDMTDRKRAEESLREAMHELRRRTEELQVVMEAVPAAVFVARDPAARTIIGNRAGRELVEVPPNVNISKSAPEQERPTGWQEMRNGVPIAPEDLPLQQAARGREVRDYEMDLVFADGPVKAVLAQATPLRDEHGNPQGGVAVLLDVTERKRAEEALRASEERYHSLFTSMDEGFALHQIVCDDQDRPIDYRFLEINPAFERLTGLKREQVVGALMTAVLPNDNPDWIRIYGKVALTGEPVHFEMYSSGLKQHYEVYSYSPAYRQFAVIFTNVTERKRAEEERERMRRDLEQRAIDLQATNKELEAFTYAVAHDLRAPLNMIEQFSDLLVDDYVFALPEDGRHVVDLIRQNSRSVNRLAEDLLTLTRMQQQPVERQVVSMRDLVSSAVAELSRADDGRQVQVAMGELPIAYADPLLIKQAWVNLLSNAFKFTRLCSAASVEIGSFEELGHTVYFVRDNGVGFDMAQSDRLFRAFQRLHHAEDFEGSGLGLAIVERIVRRHGGRVWAQGKEGKGATFYFTLE